MSSIDERIVVLTFDNHQFEGNVQTSIETLEKLKKGLNLEESAKGLTAVSKTAKSFDLSGVSTAIEDVKSRFSTLGIAGMTVVSELTKTFMGLGNKLIGAISGPLMQGGWKRALNVEQATFQMRGLLGETEEGAAKIKDIMGAVQESVMGTAYGADQAARVASQLVATGIEDGERMLGYLKGVAGAAAMTGGDYESIGQIFTTVAGQGKLMAMQLNQMAYKGLNVAATLSKQMGITEAEFRDMVSKGKITFEMFADGMQEAFGEHATKANETFTGSLANMKAALARIGQEVATPSLKNLHDIFISLRHLIDAVHVAIMPFINTLNSLLGVSTKNAVSFIDGLTDSIKRATGQITDDQKKLSDSTKDTAESVSASAEEIEKAANRVIAGEFGTGEQRREQIEALGLSYEKVQNKVNELLGFEKAYEETTEGATEATKELGKSIEQTAKFQELQSNSTEKVNVTLMRFVGGLKALLKYISTPFVAFKSTFKEVFSVDTSAILKNISKGFQNFAQSLAFTEGSADGLKTIFRVVLTFAKNAIVVIGEAVVLFSKVISSIANARNSFLEFIGSLDRANEAFDETSRKGKFIIALGDAFKNIGNIIVDFKNKIKELFETVKNSTGFQNLQAAFNRLWTTIKSIAGPYLDKFIDKITEFAGLKADFTWIDILATFLSNAADRIAKFINAILDGENPLKSFFDIFKKSKDVVGNLGDVEGTMSSFFGSIASVFSGLSLKDKFSGLKTAFSEGIKANIDESMAPEKLLETVKNRFKAFGDFLGSVDWSAILKHIGKIALIIAAVRALWNLGSVWKSISGFIDSFQIPFLQKKKEGGLSNMVGPLKDFSIAIGILAASLFVVASIPTKNLIKAGVAIGGLIVALTIASKKLEAGKFGEGGKFIAFGIAIALMGDAVSKLAGISAADLVKAEIAILGILGIFALSSKLSGGTVGAAATFAAMALAITLIIPAITALGLIPTKNLVKAGVALAAFLLEFSIATRLAQSCVGGAGAMALMALSMNLLVAPILVFSALPASKLLKAGVTIFALVVSLSAATRVAQSNVAGAASMAILAAAVNALILPMMVFGNMAVDKLLKGGITIVALVTSLSLATRLAQGAVAGAASMAIMAGAINALIIPMMIFGNMPAEKLIKGGATIVALMLSLAAATKIAQSNVAGAASMLIMAIPLTATALALSVLAVHDWDSILAASTALSEVMIAVAAATRIAGGNAKGAVSMLAMVVPLIGVAIVLAKLAAYDWQNILAAGTALSEVFLSMTVAVTILSKIPVAGGIKAAANMAIFIGALTGIIAALGALNKIEGFSDLMSGGADVLGTIGTAIGKFVGGIVGGVAEGVTSTLPMLGANLSLFAIGVQPFIAAMKNVDASVLDGIGTLTGAVLAITGANILEGITRFIGGGQSSLISFGMQLAAFAPYFKSFADQVSGIDASAVTASATAAESLAEFAKKIPNSGGLVSLVTGENDLATFGAQLAAFAPSFRMYCQMVSGIDASAVEASANAAGSLAEFAKKIPNSGGLVSMVTGDNDLVMFGAQLAAFAPSFRMYCQMISGIDAAAVEASAHAAGALAEFAEKIPNSGGLVAKVTGDNDLVTFGIQLSLFGPPFKKYCEAIQDVDMSAVEASAKAAEAIAAFAEKIPNSGGLVAKVTGDNDLGAFAKSLEAFGPAFKSYCSSISGIDTSEVETSAKSAEAIAAFAEKIPNSGGLLAKVTGDNDLGAFGESLAAFGPNFAKFAGDISGIDPGTITASASAASAVAAFAEAVPSNGGLKSLFTDSSLSKFGEELSVFGKYVADYSDKITGVNIAKMYGVNDIVPSLIEAATLVNDTDLSGNFEAFGESLSGFGSGLVKYAEQASSINLAGVLSAVQATIAIASMATTIGMVDPGALSKFSADLQKMGADGVNGFVSTMQGAQGKVKLAAAGLLTSASQGLNSTALKTAFYSAGTNAAMGLGQGLSAYMGWVAQKAAELAKRAVDAAKAQLRERSPSRAMMEVGAFAGEGLAIGIIKMGAKVESAGSKIAETAADAIANPLKKIQNLLNEDMDVNPVITPVLDLTNLRSGAGQIGSMFNSNPAFGLAGSYGVMNAAAGFMQMQSSNDDVVEAIKGLNNSNNNSTFNITVDGAENPEDFADRLVRRIKSNSRMR